MKNGVQPTASLIMDKFSIWNIKYLDKPSKQEANRKILWINKCAISNAIEVDTIEANGELVKNNLCLMV